MEKKSMWLAPSTMRTVAVAAAATAALAAGSVAGAWAAEPQWESSFYTVDNSAAVAGATDLADNQETIVAAVQGDATKPVEFVTGWYKADKDWYYYRAGNPTTQAGFVKGELVLGDQRYYFADDGKLYTNKWIQAKNEAGTEFEGNYYVNADGYVQHGWLQVGDEWFRFGEDVNKADDEGVIKRDGELLQGWSEYEGKWYYLNPITGASEDPHGEMVTDEDVDGYTINKEGTLAMGWVEENGEWSYFADGKKVTAGWKMVDGSWYYFEDGTMQTGFKTIGQKKYFFADWGGLQVGWFYLGKDVKDGINVTQAKGWYHSNRDGAIDSVQSWKSVGGKWYFFMADGHMFDKSLAYGTDGDGKVYEFSFDESGAWTGTKELGVMPATISDAPILENIV